MLIYSNKILLMQQLAYCVEPEGGREGERERESKREREGKRKRE